jgi:tetratricopeptide (TPR) repeat protein
MRLRASLPCLRLLPLLLVVTGASTGSAQTNADLAPPPGSGAAAGFNLDDWQANLHAPEAPSRSRLYQGDDANALAARAKPTPPVITTTRLAAAAPTAPKTKTDPDRLAAIAIADRDFFAALSQQPAADRDRRAQEIHDQYYAYITDHPEDVTALILYGKLLRRVGYADMAYEVFRRADQLDPHLAVVKQQLANHFAESNQPANALDLLRQAVALAPSEPVYHYEIGELLNLDYDHYLTDKTFDSATLDKTIEAEFARAAALAPLEKGFAWRHAESFYDQRNPDWKAALAAWTTLASQTTDPTELEVIHLHQARALIELGKFDEARPLLAVPVRKVLQASRVALMARLPFAAPAAPASTTAPVFAPLAMPAASTAS